ncbi:MAG TPA: ATP-binding protein [Candidatus Acidoferrales bacterium]|nr:ATP-binding protein [Candidatus Acidoferrales bacterium]
MRAIVEAVARFRLRTKFLLSLVLVTSGLMCATLLIVGHAVRSQVHRQIEEESRNAILTFRVLQRQHQIALGHKAELLANLAMMRNEDATAIQDVSDDPWQSQDDNLLLLADARGKIVALHTTAGDFPVAEAEKLLARSLKEGSTSAWWSTGDQLFQVVLRPVSSSSEAKSARQGTVVVGRAVDASTVNDLRRITSTEVAFRFNGKIITSTLAPLRELALQQQVDGGPVPSEIKIDGESYIATSEELNPEAPGDISLIVLKSYDDAIASIGPLNRALIGLLLVALFGGAAIVYLLSQRITQPLASLAEGVRALEQGDFNYPLAPRGDDEVAHVTRAFDAMRKNLQRNESERQKLEGELRQVSRIEAMGRLAGGVAHDFNNLLTVIKGHSGLLLDRLPASEALRGSTQQIASAADRAAGLTRQLLAFSRKQVLVPRVLDLNALISDLSKLLRRLIREDIELICEPAELLWRLKADPGQIEQVIMNLVVNASDAMAGGGKITIETYNVDAEVEAIAGPLGLQPGRYVALAVTDTGCGMDAETQAHIFEPFFTTKPEGKGTGLGLATVYGVVKQSNGHVFVESSPGLGSRFEIYLPQAMERAESLRWEAPAALHSGNGQRVLVVEDEASVCELASGFLSAAGYSVTSAGSAEEAMDLAEHAHESIHLLVTDVILPRMRGTELAKRLRERSPDLRIIFTSGHLGAENLGHELDDRCLFLPKPYTREALISAADELLRSAPSSHKSKSHARRESRHELISAD